MKKYLSLSFCISFFFLAACSSSSPQVKAKTEVRHKIKALLPKLTADEMVLGRHVGAGASTLAPFNAFQKLANEATVEELILLVDHRNYLVKAYAFWALVLRDQPNAQKVYEKRQNDRTMISTLLHGCVVTPMNYNRFMRAILEADELLIQMYCGRDFIKSD